MEEDSQEPGMGEEDLWHKEWAIDRTRNTRGVVSVVSYLTIRNGESEAELARGIAEAIRRYPYYTVFDDVSGTVDFGKHMAGDGITFVHHELDAIGPAALV